MSVFVSYQCDFNIPIDKEENTFFMFSLIVKDDLTTNFCAEYLKKLNISVKNKFGESITSLTFKLGRYDLLDYYKKNPIFDYYYRDSVNHNTLLILSSINSPMAMKELLENDTSIINETNIKNENALIVAIKVRNIETIKILLQYGINVNHQDELGNTALHYAVKMKDPYLIHQLVAKKGDIHSKNNEGLSPFDIANEYGQNEIIKALTDPSITVINSATKEPTLYYEEIQKYLTPYITNKYPNYKPTKFGNKIKEKIYSRNKGIIVKPQEALTIMLLL